MKAWLDCMNNFLSALFTALMAAGGALVFAMLVTIAGCIFTGNAISACILSMYGLFALLGAAALGVGALFLATLMVACALNTRSAGVTGAVGPTPVGKSVRDPAVAPKDCAWAKSLLADAQARLQIALTERDAQAVATQSGRNRFTGAQAAEAGAAAMVVAAVFNPAAMVAALAALAAATAALLLLANQLAAAVNLLAQRNADVTRLLAEVAAAEALVLTLCGPADPAAQGGILDGNVPNVPVVVIRR